VREARRKVLVQPFYLQMMRLNAVQAGSEMTEMIASVAADVTVTEIVALLRSDSIMSYQHVPGAVGHHDHRRCRPCRTSDPPEHSAVHPGRSWAVFTVPTIRPP
jgi:hypothetical protein